MPRKYLVERWDENPKNVTFNTWVYITSFQSKEEAQAYIERASTPTQKLSFREEN